MSAPSEPPGAVMDPRFAALCVASGSALVIGADLASGVTLRSVLGIVLFLAGLMMFMGDE